MKKILCVIMALSLLAAVGCGDTTDTTESEPTTEATTAATTEATTVFTTTTTTKKAFDELLAVDYTTKTEAKKPLDNIAEIEGLSFRISTSWIYKNVDSNHYWYEKDSSFLMIIPFSEGLSGFSENEISSQLAICYDALISQDYVSEYTPMERTTIASHPAIRFNADIEHSTAEYYYIACDNYMYCISFEKSRNGNPTIISNYIDDIIGSVSFTAPDSIQTTEEPMTEAITTVPITEPLTEAATTAPRTSFEPITVSGYGDTVVQDITIPAKFVAYTASHDGDGNFVSIYYDCSGDKEYLINKIGAYNATQIFDATDQDDTSAGMLEVKANGNWSISFVPVQSVISPTATTSFTGTGTGVIGSFIGTGNTLCTAIHDGQNNFIVRAYEYADNGDMEYVINEIGAYNGQSVFQTEKGKLYFFEVVADGNWSITVQ